MVTYAVVATFVELSEELWVVATTPSAKVPLILVEVIDSNVDGPPEAIASSSVRFVTTAPEPAPLANIIAESPAVTVALLPEP